MLINAEFEIAGRGLTAPRKAWIEPASFAAATDCLIFLDGELYRNRVGAPGIIRRAQDAGLLQPTAAVYLSGGSAAERHVDYTCNEDFASFVAVDVPQWIERMAGRFDRLYLCGLSLSGLQALFTALRHPGVFSGVLAQSPSAWWREEWLSASLATVAGQRSRFWLSVGTQELQTNVSHPPTPLFQGASQLDSVRRLAAGMTNIGLDVHAHEYDGGHDPACWGAELSLALSWLLTTA